MSDFFARFICMYQEYLALFHQIDLPVYSLEQILKHEEAAVLEKVEHPLIYFKQYLQTGYYPFSNEPDFALRIEQIVRQTIESDIAQYAVNNKVLSSRVSDFTIGDYTFEVGGKKKGNKQIEDVPNGMVVKDDIEYGALNTIPLWAFGLNY